MQRLGIGLVLAALVAGAGCGGGDDSAGVDPGSGGSGGQAGSGGAGGGDAGPVDTTPPTFAGLESAAPKGESTVALTWKAATDDASAAARIAYRVYAAEAAGAQDFSKPLVTTPAGSTGATLTALAAGTTFYFVVRAVDEAGNEDANTAEKSAATGDASPPAFDGVAKATPTGSTTLKIEWSPATDNGTDASQIKYRVSVSDTAGVHDFSQAKESAPGDASLVVSGLTPETKYYVAVHAVDGAGNEDANKKEISATTLEGQPPTFGGLRSAKADNKTITLRWAPASDNVSAATNIVYDIFQSATPGGESFAAPSYTSAAGAVSYTVTGLTLATKYYFVVRARDEAGNSDGNTTEVGAMTPIPDTKPPTFAGAASAASATPTDILVTWAAATDDKTPPSQIVYDVYVANMAGGESYGTPSFTTAPGATSYLLTGLSPNTTRYAVVRARDLSGNRDANTAEVTATTGANGSGDTTPPTWGSGPSLTIDPSHPNNLIVSWAAATDDTHPANEIRYLVCADTVESNCLGAQFKDHLSAATDWGTTNVTLTSLRSHTAYYVYVRAEDMDGNLATDDHGTATTTPSSFSDDVLPILDDRCNTCHTFTYDSIVSVKSVYSDPTYGQLDLVKPDDAAMSYLYRKINPQGLQSPPFSATVPNTFSDAAEPRDGSGTLSSTEDGAIRDWIEQGAFPN